MFYTRLHDAICLNNEIGIFPLMAPCSYEVLFFLRCDFPKDMLR